MREKQRFTGSPGTDPAGRPDPVPRLHPPQWPAFAVIALGAVTATTWFAVGLGSLGPPAPPTTLDALPSPKPTPTPEDLRGIATARARAELDRADAACERALDERLHALDAFFADARSRAPRFADKALSWEARWLSLADRLPGAAGGRYAGFLRRAFAEEVFAPEQLDEVVRRAVAGYLAEVRDAEDEALGRLGADLVNMPTPSTGAWPDPADLRAAVAKAASGAAASAGTGQNDDLARDLVFLLAGEVLARAAARLAVTAGLMTVGIGTAPVTLGAGVLAALVVAQLLVLFWDPAADLARSVEKQRDALRASVVDGTPEAPGLGRRLDRRRR